MTASAGLVLDGAHDVRHPAAGQRRGPRPPAGRPSRSRARCAVSRARENLVRRHPVARQRARARRDAAVRAAPDAVVRDLDEAAQVDGVAHALAPHRVGAAPERVEGAARRLLAQPGQDRARRSRVVERLRPGRARNASRAAGNGASARSKMPSE